MTAHADAVQGFLRAARRRLWLGEGLRVARAGLWAAGALLVTVGAVHAFILALSPRVPLIALAAVAIAAAITGLWRRPSLQTAARRTDREFGGRAVMTTARECLASGQAASPAAERIVLAQAGQAARDWRPKLDRRLRPTGNGNGTAAFIPVFIGVLLLIQPGAQRPTDAARDTPGNALSINGAGLDAPAPKRDDLATLRRELAAENGAPPSAGAEPEIIAGQPEARPANDTTADQAQPQQSPAEGTGRGTDAQGGVPGDAAGDALPATIAGPDAEARLAIGAGIGIARSGEAAAATTPARRGFEATEAAPAYGPVDALPAAPPGSTREQSTLSPAQAAYAARYLDERGTNND